MDFRSLTLAEFIKRSEPFLKKVVPVDMEEALYQEYINGIMPLIQKRAKTLAEVPDLVQFFFVDELDYDASLLISKNMDYNKTRQALETSRQQLGELVEFNAESLEALLRPLAVELGLKTGQLFGVLRVAVTGRTAAPPLFQTMAVLGKEQCLRRIEAALHKLHELPA